MQDMVEFIVIELRPDMPKGHGSHQFRVAPRVGEFITFNVDDIGQAFEVVAVLHPLEPAHTAGDLYIKHWGEDLELRVHLERRHFPRETAAG